MTAAESLSQHWFGSGTGIMAWCQSGSKPLPETASYIRHWRELSWCARHHMVTNTQIFRFLIITDAGAQLKSLECFWWNRWVSQLRVLLTACCELAVDYNTLSEVLYVFERKMWYIIIHAPYNLIVVFWHISNIPPVISQSQICDNIPTFCIAAIFVEYRYNCYTRQLPGCYNLWANICCSGCSSLGQKLLWKGTILRHYYESSMSKTSRMGLCILLNDIIMNYHKPW